MPDDYTSVSDTDVSVEIVVPDELSAEVVTLRRYRLDDVSAVKESIAASFAELNRWMPWAQSRPTDESVLAFVKPSAEQFGGDKDANYAITLTGSGRFVGSCGLMQCGEEGAAEIGYWVDTRHTGRGIATTAADMLTRAAFATGRIVRVFIRCDEANAASAKVPEKLGYHLARVEDRFDQETGHAVRAMLWVMERDAAS